MLVSSQKELRDMTYLNKEEILCSHIPCDFSYVPWKSVIGRVMYMGLLPCCADNVGV